jgi:two-component system chemotaxis response regulator CheB
VQHGRAADDIPAVFHLVAIAASAGGLPALVTILAHLPHDFPLPIVIVQHLDPNHVSLLPHLLAHKSLLTVKRADHDDVIAPGVVYVAPPAHHLQIADDGRIALTQDDPVRFLRPCADRLFATAARVLGPIIGVVLTGTGSDGADGAEAIKIAGGLVIAQDEATSAFFGMPQAAIRRGVVDHVLALNDIAPALEALTQIHA